MAEKAFIVIGDKGTFVHKIPLDQAQGIIDGSMVIVPNWKPFNQEDERTWPESKHSIQYFCCIDEKPSYDTHDDDRVFKVCIWCPDDHLWMEPYGNITKYMPMPKG